MAGSRHVIESADGTSLSARESGDPLGRPILFLHGTSQSQLCFTSLFDAPALQPFRLVSFDYRGHGESDKPTAPARYQQGRHWAEDVSAVLTSLHLDRPVVVGWSLGARVAVEYLRWYGEDSISALNIVASAPVVDHAGAVFGPAVALLRDMCSEDLERNIAATTTFVRACSLLPSSPESFARAVAYNMVCPPYARRLTESWPFEDPSEVLQRLTIPILLSHGWQDEVISTLAVDLMAALMPEASVSMFADCGHTPFLEHEGRFVEELVGLAART